jgi:RNA polymerase sigma factor (sigma-70 family)
MTHVMCWSLDPGSGASRTAVAICGKYSDEMRGATTDAEVVEASLVDPRAFGVLFDRHHRAVRHYLIRRIGGQAAEDLSADVFVTAFEHRHRYDLSRPNARPWLFGIATNLLRHCAREERTRLEAYLRRATAEAHVPEDVDQVEDRLDAERALPALIRALLELPQGDRDALLLHAWAELSYPDIAEALAIPIGTVRSRLHRARRSMRELLHSDAATTNETTKEA